MTVIGELYILKDNDCFQKFVRRIPHERKDIWESNRNNII